MADHRVANLKAALELAESWRAAGTHSWFRGQNRLWPIASSLGRRRSSEDKARSKGRLQHFCDWLDGVPELRHLLAPEQVHAFFAVLQHYGMPTHYVDFTINAKVAAYFAGVGPDATLGEEGCIIAIDPDDWVEKLRDVAEAVRWPPNLWPEKIVVKVPNLWRLEAQSGYFVYLPVEQPEGYSPVDRIVFPHEGIGIEVAEEEIYPSRKSALEERLDEFFTEELMRGNQAILREMARNLYARGAIELFNCERPDSRDGLRPGKGAHESWRSMPSGWSQYVHEQLRDTRDGTATEIAVDPTAPLVGRERLQETLRRFLNRDPGARRKAVDWKVVPVTPGTPPGWVAFVERAVTRAWDGVRRLPYTDQQVAGCMAMILTLASVRVSEAPIFSARDFSTLLGSVLHMELANDRNVTARAAMAEATYERALRPDLEEAIVVDLLGRPRTDLRKVLDPPHLFDFDRLTDAFAFELIPTQVLIQRPDLAVFFSPAQTSIVGAA